MYKLNADEQELADKLADAGPTQEEAEQWVKDIVIAAEKRGGSPETAHACSCHEKSLGPCEVCRDYGCRVWDFNQTVYSE